MASRESSNGGLNPAAAGVPDLSSHAPDTVYRPVQRQFSNIGGGTKEKARPRSVVTGVRKPDCTARKIGILEPLKAISQRNVILAGELVIVTCLGGDLAAVYKSSGIINEMHQTVTSCCGNGRSRAEALCHIQHGAIRNPRLLA